MRSRIKYNMATVKTITIIYSGTITVTIDNIETMFWLFLAPGLKNPLFPYCLYLK